MDLMTFQPGRHADPAHAPLVPLRDRLMLPPALLVATRHRADPVAIRGCRSEPVRIGRRRLGPPSRHLGGVIREPA